MAEAGSSGVSHSRCKGREEGVYTQSLACAQLEFSTPSPTVQDACLGNSATHIVLGHPTLTDLMKTIPYRHATGQPNADNSYRDSSQETLGCIKLTGPTITTVKTGSAVVVVCMRNVPRAHGFKCVVLGLRHCWRRLWNL